MKSGDFELNFELFQRDWFLKKLLTLDFTF